MKSILEFLIKQHIKYNDFNITAEDLLNSDVNNPIIYKGIILYVNSTPNCSLTVTEENAQKAVNILTKLLYQFTNKFNKLKFSKIICR